MAKKTPKATVTKAHRMARGMLQHRAGVRNPWAVGMAQATRSARRKRKR